MRWVKRYNVKRAQVVRYFGNRTIVGNSADTVKGLYR